MRHQAVESAGGRGGQAHGRQENLQIKLFLYTRNRRTSHLFEINTLREIIIILGKLPYLIVQVLIMNSC
ncbi:MAG: hypothetical protein ACK559_27875, partial [bacterium]